MATGLLARALVLLPLVVCVAAVNVAAQPPDAWPMYGHDAAHTGRTTHKGALTASLVPAFGTAFQIAVAPDGTFYGGFTEDLHGIVRAYRPDGTLKWERDTGFAANVSSVAVGPDGTPYAVSGVTSDTLYALNIANGTVLWSRSLGNVSLSKLSIGSDGAIYIGIQRNAETFGELLAYRPDGSLKWKWNPEIPNCGVESTAAIGPGGVVYIQHNCAGLVSLNEATGAENWRLAATGDPFNSPSVAQDGTIYIGSGDRRFRAINPAGTQKWNVDVQGFMFYTAQAISADGLTIYRGDNDGIFYAFTSTGSIKWSYDTGSDAPLSDATLASNGLVFFSAQPGTLFALRTADGSLAWSSPAAGAGAPIAGPDGTFYVPGEVVYSFKHTGPIHSVTVKAPNRSLDWGIGARQLITWQHDVGSAEFMKIEVSRDGGVTFTEIAAAVQNSTATAGQYEWQVTGPATNTARVRVSWTADPSVADASDANFKIADPFIKVTGPKSGSNWGYGTSQQPKWTTNLGPSDRVTVLYNVDGGSFTVLKPNVTATAKKAKVDAPTLTSPSDAARIRIEWVNPPAGVMPVQGTSPNITIEPPFVTVTAPVAGETWVAGSKKTILFANNLGALEKVKIELSKDGGATYPITIVSNSKADGKHAVTVAAAWGSQTTTRIRVSWMKVPAIRDESDLFTIQP